MSKFILKTVELAVSRGEEKLLRSFGDVILFDDEILNQGRRDAVVEIAFFKEGQIPSVLMFRDAVALKPLFESLSVSSFFEGKYGDMSPSERHLVFQPYFKWQRRRSFVLFLVSTGYLMEDESLPICEERAPCDSIFEVEDHPP